VRLGFRVPEETRRSRGDGRTSGCLKCGGLANGLPGVPKCVGGTPMCVCLRCGRARDEIDK
jgi:hypothetical protein